MKKFTLLLITTMLIVLLVSGCTSEPTATPVPPPTPVPPTTVPPTAVPATKAPAPTAAPTAVPPTVAPTTVPPTAAPTIAPTAAPTVAPTTAPTEAPKVVAGLYVTNLRLQPQQPTFNNDVNFFPTFNNTTGSVQNLKWLVYIFRADTPNKSNNETTAQTSAIPAGSGEIQSPGAFRYGATGNQCEYFFARVGWLDASNKTTYFNDTDGKPYEKGFSVCAQTAGVNTPVSGGLYITNLRLAPSDKPQHNQDVTFFATFNNNSNAPLNFRWLVYIYKADEPTKTNNETTAQQTQFPVGSGEYQATGSFKYGATGNQCEYFFARVGWLDSNNKTVFFTQPDGKPYEKGFSVCN